jgi:cytochrome c-type biogenesis protein CcmH
MLGCAGTLPLLAVALYLAFGAPTLPGQPFAGRVKDDPSKASVAELIAKVEARLRDNPSDGQGWDVIGPVYLFQQRYGEAAEAFKRAMALNGETPKRLTGFVQASISAANGIVSEDARRALETLAAHDAGNIEARFWLAVAKEQDGKLLAAAEDLKSMLETGPPGGAWRPNVEDRLRAIATRLGPMAGAPFAAVLPKVKDGGGTGVPDAADIASLLPEERAAVIGKMVDGLAERLKTDGRDLAGWQKLARAYTVLGRKADATAALAEARKIFSSDAKALAELDGLAKSLGLGG